MGERVQALVKWLREGKLELFRLNLNEVSLEELSAPLRDENGGTILHLAAELGRLDEMFALIQHGVCSSLEDVHKATPLEIGIRGEFKEIKLIYVIIDLWKAVSEQDLTLLKKSLELLNNLLELPECHKKNVEIFTNIQLDSLLLESARAGHIKVMEILIQYKIRNFEYVLKTLPIEANFSISFIRLCKSICEGETELASLFLEGNPDKTSGKNENFISEMKLLQPLLDDEYFKLSVFFLLAVESGNIISACEIFLKSKNFLLNQGRNLNFSGCLLPEIQSFFAVLPIDIDLIVEINLNFNRLTILDNSICDLPNLTKLSVSNNRLWLISSDVLQLKNLLHLDLSYNLISELPAVVMSKKIKYLYLQGNKFRHFPSCLENSYLIELNLSRNQLVELSPSVSTIKYLRKLDLSYNPYLLRLPTSLGKIEVALNLQATESLINIPLSMATDIWAFYKQRLNSEVTISLSEIVLVDACNEIELFEAVKTDLEKQFKDSTNINIVNFGVTFGFQHVHEVLGINPSVYLLVWEIGNVDSKIIREIVQYMNIFDPKSPIHIGVVVAQNVQVDVLCLIEELQFDDGIKIFILRMEPATNNPIIYTDHLRDELLSDTHVVKKSYTVPGCFIGIQELVKEMREKNIGKNGPIISKSEFWENIRMSLGNSDLLGIEELSTIIEFLENTGYISYFPSNNHGCEDLVFLERDWIVGLIEHTVGRSTHSSLYLNSYTITQLGLEELLIRYSKSQPPAGIYYFLAQNAIAMPLDQNSWFVPSVLAPEQLMHIPNSNYSFFAIDYQPWSLWVRLIAHILNCLPAIVGQFECLTSEATQEDIALTRYKITKWGILIQNRQNYILRIVKKRNEVLDSNGIEISVPNTDGGSLVLKLMYSYLYSLIKHWYPRLILGADISVYCPICVQNNLDTSHAFCWKAILPEILEDVSITCPKHSKKIHISDLLPAFYPEDLSIDDTTQSINFNLQRHCDVLGFECGTFRDMEVLFKKYPMIAEGTISKRNSGIEMYSAWAEIEIYQRSRTFDTPFLHKLVAYSTKPLICALESGPSENMENLLFVRKVELNYNFKIRILTQICEALVYLHRSKIMHRGIRTESVLVCSLCHDTEVNVKLGKFENAATTMFVGYLRQNVGEYPAPEMLVKDGTMEYEERTDMFSFGFLIYEICTGLRAFEYQREKIEDLISYGFRPNCPKVNEVAYSATALMESCWKKSPSRRPFAEEALKYLKVPLTKIVQAQQEIKRIEVFYLADITQDFDRNLVIAHGQQGIKLDLMHPLTLDRITTTTLPSQFIVTLLCARNFIFLTTIEKNIIVVSSSTLDILHIKELENVVICIEVVGDVLLAGDENGRVTIFEMDTITGNLSITYHIEANSYAIKSIIFSKGKVYSISRGYIHVFSINLMEMKHFITDANMKEIQGLRITHSNDGLHFFYRRGMILHTWDTVKMEPNMEIDLTSQVQGDRQKQKHYIMSIESCDPWLFLGLSTGYVYVFSTVNKVTRLITTYHVHSSSLRSLQILNINYPPSTMLFTLGEGFTNLPMVKRTGRTLTMVKESMYRCILDIFPVLPRENEIEKNTFKRLSAPLPALKECLDGNDEFFELMKPSRPKLTRSMDLLNSMSIDLDPIDFLDTPTNSSISSITSLCFDTISSSTASD
ncbi:Leucine-rich repeat serine/threonine-protein kinase 1-like [Oopsacas minuta]|uniref:Leucine-rich repeat serine/threonine-protein kinase 1-like n=1 Tax=Oopsacas minuta TaxID=111878 RepID=A0AAV7JIY0_9METZ|nr:Leucine-rich repeat serine/threonine-protein kinase 1-like [Oopsacas minuta]